jgi:hypothetical protein
MLQEAAKFPVRSAQLSGPKKRVSALSHHAFRNRQHITSVVETSFRLLCHTE